MRSKGIMAAMVFFLAVGGAWATTSQRVTRLCPVCGAEVEGMEVCSTSTGGCDLDLRPCYLGASVIAIVPVTCTRCYYSGFLSDFGEKEGKKGPAITEAQRKRIVEAKALKPRAPIEAGTPSYRISSVVRQDLIWQTRKCLGADPERLARVALTGSWLVREGAFLGRQLPKEVIARHEKWMGTVLRGEGSARLRDLMDLRGVAFFLMLDREFDEEETRHQGALAAMLLAARCGEYRLALTLLGRLEGLLGADCATKLKGRIEGFAADEALFQRRALEAFDAVKLEELTDPMARFDLLYMRNELVRRLNLEERAAEASTRLETQLKAMTPPSPYVPFLAHLATGLARAATGKTGDELVEAYLKVLAKVDHPRAELGDLDALLTKVLEAQGIKRRSWLR